MKIRSARSAANAGAKPMGRHASIGRRLYVRGVHKQYGSIRALVGVDIEASAGDIVALLGPNGAGKTTLVSIVAGLRRQDRGQVHVNGIYVRKDGHAARAQLGLAPQETGIYRTVSVRDNLQFFGELAGLRRRHLRERILEVAEAFALVDLLGRPAQTLSGGQARRLHTAMVVMHRPPLLLLDEPTAGVDVETRNRLLGVVRSLAEEGSAVCYSTHYLHEVEQLEATSVTILVNGTVAASGSIADLVRTHSGASVELHFSNKPPNICAPDSEVEVDGNVVRVRTAAPPAVRAAELLSTLGPYAASLREIKLIQPSLESVYLAITAKTHSAATANQ
jgi:ABC-2 type transport system ATP-binding protein